MAAFEPGCLPAALGSLPLTDPHEACELALDLVVQKELARADLMQRALITASCGLGTLPVAAAARACRLTAGVSARARYLRRP